MNLDLEKLPTTEQIHRFVGDYLTSRRALLITAGALVGALAVFIGLTLFKEVSAKNSAEAWRTYTEVLDTQIASKTPEEIRAYAAGLENLRDPLAGTLVEPWLLKDLGNTYFYLHDIPGARAAYETLQSRYPDHVATVGLKNLLVFSDTVAQALEDCERQADFFTGHGLPPKPVEEEATEGEEGDDEASGEVVVPIESGDDSGE